MKNSRPLYAVLVFLFLSSIVINACRKKNQPSDELLYDLAQESSGHVWYKRNSALLPRRSGSGHSEAFLRTRFNNVAAAMLDTDGKVRSGITFPEGSLIVKELYTDDNTLGSYAIMYKDKDSKDADENNWVWGYMRANGDVRASATEKGKACRSCHMQNGHIDLSLMNVSFP